MDSTNISKVSKEELLKELELIAAEYKELKAAAKAILTHQDFNKSAKEIFSLCKKVTGATSGYVALLSADGSENEVLFLDSGDLDCTVDESLPMPIRGLRATSYHSLKGVYDNSFADSHWMKFLPKGHMRLENVMFAPLIINNKAVGLIGLANKKGGFNQRDVDFVQGLGDIAAIALRNSKNLEAIQNYRNQQKLESIGTLASGVAHEINNPINGILNYAQLIIDIGVENNDINEYAGEIINESERVSKIVKNLLEFSKQSKEGYKNEEIEDIISRTLSLTKAILRKDQIELTVNIAEDIPLVKCRSQHIQQVIMNLIINAKDALNNKYPEYNENKKINLVCAMHNSDRQKWVRISVEDFGTGISKNNINKIFDPFFSTKGRIEGTGLGLSISYGIVKEHNGELNFETKEGEYTKFYFDLPLEDT